MAESATEDTKLSVNKNDMSETSPTTSATNKVSSDEEKDELADIDKASTSKEAADNQNEKVANDTDLLDKEEQNSFKTDCNGDSKEETNPGNVSSEKIEAEIKENVKEISSTEAKSGNEEVTECRSDVDERLDEILKVVHGDLQMIERVARISTPVKDNDEDENGKERQTVRKEETVSEDDAVDSSQKCTTSATSKSTEGEKDSKNFSMKAEEKSEIGIVGSPTTISELINEEELRGDSALSADQKDHIVEWVENSVKINADEENNVAEECQSQMYEKDTMETGKLQKLDDVHVISSRKSQKIVSNIIKKSIKWMPQCAVSTCRNSHRRTRKQSVRYHRFPHRADVRESWVRACGREPLANGDAPFNINTARVCSRHFLVEFYEDESREQVMQGNQKRNRLRNGAVPTVAVPVRVEPLFDLLNETEKKRSAQASRLKVPNPKRVLLRTQDSGIKAASLDQVDEGPRRYDEEDDNGEGSNSTNNSSSSSSDSNNSAANEASLVTTTVNEEEKLDTKLKQKLSFLRALGLIDQQLSCLNRMHAMEGATEGRRRQVNTAEENDEKTPKSSSSSEIPQSQQNGAALPEETAAAPTATASRVRVKRKAESSDTETPVTKSRQLLATTSRQKVAAASNVTQRQAKAASVESVETKKRKSTNGQLSVNPRKKFCNDDEREEYISQIVGNDNETVDVLMVRADRLRTDILALENLAHAKEMEWNEILRKRKLKEEAYVRLERKIQMTAYMDSDGQLPDPLPLATSSLGSAEWDNSDNAIPSREKFESKEDLIGERSLDSLKREKGVKFSPQQRIVPPKTNGENSRKRNQTSSPESRQIGEGRQGAIVDVRSIIADHRLKHPETVPRRGRRMRNSVNVALGAGGAMVETGHNTDSRPSSTESCKSNPSTNDSMNYKDILVQFAKMSQQGEGTATKVPQNYPDVTLHPVAAPSSAPQNTASQSTGSLLHGILTKAQSPRSTTFSPTLARLLTAPERERSSPAAAAMASMSQQSATTQHLLQTYQGSNLVSINDILSSSKARTEITITPVVNSSAQSHSNDLIQVEDVEEEATVIDDRKGSSTSGRDGKQMAKDNPPSPSAPPKCQGCMIRPAQFVCAGCGNQWYCSRQCQLAAWATHSEYCSDYPLESENSKVKSNV
ncbi:uncharacterized protein LOC114932896 isoform X1 [Nylanderia fulva]|uniref:uncharacterized protein LOC114932896 isoform X1 n=1 Tax=Nylanderia fulva TaxID=613905 RepID=UPI0010FB18E8|nr:uncharacterized protein LOC114932896 isoform X1 [Nylanderia fulva]XP_029161148.1 uncharacterized protein LOC114932896 isoform X1 [Nylanderia fulva]XP_029161154.1 uncharacterized protein LOC114932896 isoform X1 [Nylanderia fulva]XP_029161160.1 uncharacterized protein LOC114932896 isoform X1 [Nylanderia fulva]